MPFNSQANQFSKLYVIKEEINTTQCESIKEGSRFITYFAHAVQPAGSSEENRLSHVNSASDGPERVHVPSVPREGTSGAGASARPPAQAPR